MVLRWKFSLIKNTLFKKFIVASELNLFLYLSKRESLYKSTSSLLLSDVHSKLWQTDFTLFIRLKRWWLKLWLRRR